MFRAFWLSSSFLVIGFLSLFHAGSVRTQPVQVPASADMKRFWSDLADADATRAYQAIVSMMLKREDTVAFLAAHLPPATPPPPKQVEQWIKDLNSPRFAERDRGNRELENLGGLAEKALRSALQKDFPLEVTRRIEQLLQRLAG
ncbi:MAG TPA: hypothetical protein VKE98_21735, partial [Gemmataceae bacterium]|nr:hypothetical protein [Gemmataceae bacterium]